MAINHRLDENISVIIPVHDRGPKLERCLKSLADYGRDIFETIVVLDGTSIEKDFFLQYDLATLKVERLAQNYGPAYARNHGASVASGDLLFFIDSDVALLPDTVDQVIRHFRKSDVTDALIGSYDDAPDEKALVSKFRNLLHHYTHQQGLANATTFWGACGVIKKEVFQAVGGFDTSFDKPSVEDIALGYRLKERGFSIRLDKTLQVKHLKKWTLLNMIKTDIFLRARPWTRLLHQYKKLGVNDLNINYQERLAVALLAVAILSLAVSLSFRFLLPVGLVGLLFLVLFKRKTYGFFSRHFAWYQLPAIVLLHWIYLASALTGFVIATSDRLFKPNQAGTSGLPNEPQTYEKDSFALNE
ncbi:MAG: glycosyltransferase family 2 protein [Roseivirga sp.]|nr:glycosyltransferase family 2 protein [Roseivirga sp.]